MEHLQQGLRAPDTRCGGYDTEPLPEFRPSQGNARYGENVSEYRKTCNVDGRMDNRSHAFYLVEHESEDG